MLVLLRSLMLVGKLDGDSPGSEAFPFVGQQGSSSRAFDWRGAIEGQAEETVADKFCRCV